MTTSNTAQVRSDLDEIVKMARDAGAIIRDRYAAPMTIEAKGGVGQLDIVTEVDHAAEDLICERVHQLSPTAVILAEERGLHQAADIESAVHSQALPGPGPGPDGIAGIDDLWLIDPLDGTVNYAMGLPLCAVSIARYSRGEPVAGAIYLPILDEMFTFETGKGAYHDGERMRISDRTQVSQCLLAVGSTHHPMVPEATRPCLGWRRIGSAAVSFAYVACGRFDAYLQLGRLAPWDYGAGVPLVIEAGGKVTEYIERPWRYPLWRNASVVAASPYMHQQIVNVPH